MSIMYVWSLIFFFKQTTAYEMSISDWSADVCSSDLRKIVCSFCVRHCLDEIAETLRAPVEKDVPHPMRMCQTVQPAFQLVERRQNTGKARANVAIARPRYGQIDRENQHPAARRLGAFKQRLHIVAILDHVELEPERLGCRGAHLLDGAYADRGRAKWKPRPMPRPRRPHPPHRK